MGDLKRGIKGSYDSMRKKMGLKGPGKGALQRKEERRKTDKLDDDQLAAINEQMGLGTGLAPGRRGRRGRPRSIYDRVSAYLGGG